MTTMAQTMKNEQLHSSYSSNAPVASAPAALGFVGSVHAYMHAADTYGMLVELAAGCISSADRFYLYEELHYMT